MTPTRFTLDSSTPSLWRVTFHNPPINLIDSVMIGELGELFADIEKNQGPAVLVFDSADPDYFLAHYDITAANRSLVDALPPGPSGFHPWIDLLVRLSKLPAVTISAIRGRARAAGSEFALATDIRFASRERTVLGQMEVGFGAVPGAGPTSWLPRLVGRGRAFEILLGGEDFGGALAERYGYVNRAIPDDEFENFVDRFARRVATFDRQALATSSSSSTTYRGRLMRSFHRRWTHSGKRWRVRPCRRGPPRRSKTDCNNARMSNFASASTWDSSVN